LFFINFQLFIINFQLFFIFLSHLIINWQVIIAFIVIAY